MRLCPICCNVVEAHRVVVSYGAGLAIPDELPHDGDAVRVCPATRNDDPDNPEDEDLLAEIDERFDGRRG